jgi:hypothetical protein
MKKFFLLIMFLFLPVASFAQDEECLQDSYFSLYTAHPSGYVDSANNRVHLSYWNKETEKWILIADLEDFNNEFFKTFYVTENIPPNGYDREKENPHNVVFSDPNAPTQMDRHLFIADSAESFLSRINVASASENYECYAANYSGGNVNRDDNFWTCVQPQKKSVEKLRKTIEELSSCSFPHIGLSDKLENSYFSFSKAHPSGYIDSNRNRFFLNYWNEEEKKWEKVADLGVFNSKFFKTFYVTENIPPNGYDPKEDNPHEAVFSDVNAPLQSDRYLFVSKGRKNLLKKLKISILNGERECSASNYAGGNLNRNDNFWTCSIPKNDLIEEVNKALLTFQEKESKKIDENIFYEEGAIYAIFGDEKEKLSVQDPETFEKVETRLYKDKYNVYAASGGCTFSVPGKCFLSLHKLNLNPSEFKKLNYWIFKDSHLVVTRNGKILDVEDPKTFQLLGDTYKTYAKDKNNVYWYKGGGELIKLKGINVNTFEELKEKLINRAEFTKILLEAKYSSEEIARAKPQNFIDIPAGEWYEDYANFAKEKGFIRGYQQSDGTFKFSGEKNILFAEAAKILVNVLIEKTDSADTGNWYSPFIKKLKDNNITIYEPGKNLTRGEMAHLAYEALSDIKCSSSKECYFKESNIVTYKGEKLIKNTNGLFENSKGEFLTLFDDQFVKLDLFELSDGTIIQRFPQKKNSDEVINHCANLNMGQMHYADWQLGRKIKEEYPGYVADEKVTTMGDPFGRMYMNGGNNDTVNRHAYDDSKNSFYCVSYKKDNKLKRYFTCNGTYDSTERCATIKKFSKKERENWHFRYDGANGEGFLPATD